MRKLAIVAVALSLIACKDEPGSMETLDRTPKDQPKASTVIKVESPVPWGLKRSCAKILDTAKLSAALGKEVTVEDKSLTEEDATSVCPVRLGGTPPTKEEQDRKWMENNRVLGIMPGDELCTITLTCGFVFNVAEEKAKCEKDGQTVSKELGELLCLKKFEVGPDYRYVFSAFDPDTKCKIRVNPGPSSTDEATPKACMKAALELIGPEQIKQ